VGGLEPFYAGDSAWQRPFVTTGAWREDEEDVVFHYDNYEISPGLNYALVSITHFWDADQGDVVPNLFRLRIEQPPLPPLNIDIGPYENAFDKLIRLADGGWVLWYPRTFRATNATNGHVLGLTPLNPGLPSGIPISYTGLTSFYLSGHCALRSDQDIFYTVFDSTAGLPLDPHTVSTMIVGPEVRDAIVWEVLGRMCHLLADQSVPPHAHRDEHGLHPDSYENYVGGPGDPFTVWHHGNVGGPLIPPPGTHPLHLLMDAVQQVADHFGSNGPTDGDGNNIAGGNPLPAEIAFPDSVNLAGLGAPTTMSGPWTQANLENVRDRTIPLLIRATAGLLHWFSTETQLITSVSPEPPPGSPAEFSFLPNYPNPFNPATTIRFSIPVRSAVRLEVYSLDGRRGARLVDEVRPAGVHEFRWDAAGAASGTYMVRLLAPGFAGTRKILLVR
jgi:hypothetical protein